ncbi:unnamed protein product [Paramecium primaurelia]|uniref:Uncharacterized protein n=1 Tax=Paramecium primaurelia TaxID=5886 RepID=A0A8S1LJI9_PARPR|nr:unnamed protein product [Paramecium primaurelia]
MLRTDQIINYSALYIDMQYRNLFNTQWSYIKPFDQDKYIQQQKKYDLEDQKNKKYL